MPLATLNTSPVKAKRIELFRAGERRDSQGNVRAWTLAELDEMAATYNSVIGVHDAPILVGHDGNTSYGWLERVYREGDTLLGDYKEVEPAFALAVNQGRYKKRSISIYPRDHADNPTPGKLNIRHLAYVGIPAVKGLKDHKFSDSGQGFLEYEEFMDAPPPVNGFEALVQLFQLMRDRTIEASGIEVANEQFPKVALDRLADLSNAYFIGADEFYFRLTDIENRIAYVLDRLDSMAMQGQYSEFQEIGKTLKPLLKDKEMDAAALAKATKIKEADCQAFIDGSAMPDKDQLEAIAKALDVKPDDLKPTKKTTNMSEQNPPTTPAATPATATAPISDAQYAEMKAEIAELRGLLQQSQTQITTLTAENQQLAGERERDRVTNFVEGLVRDRKVLPTEKDSKIQLALAMSNDVAVDFTESNGDKVQKTPRQRYLDDLAAGRVLWSSDEMPTGPEHAPSFAEANTREARALGNSVDAASVKQDAQIRAKAREMGLDPNIATDYAEAMDALNIQV